MKAIVCTGYGPPEVLQLRDVAKPVPKDNEVLIKVHASTVVTGDVRIRGCDFAPWFWLPGRIMLGMTRPRETVPGCEVAGEIEAVGSDVTRFSEGDHVFGIAWGIAFAGANAQYMCLAEDGMITTLPANNTFEQAVAIPNGGLSALHFLREGDVGAGKKTLIFGASGSVGTFAVQLARHFGADVTAVCSTANLELVQSLGAHRVIDYKQEDFTKSGETWDVIFDAVGNTLFSRCTSSLEPRGVYLTVDWPLLDALWASVASRRKLIFGIAKDNPEDLIFLKELVEAGELKAVVDRTYPLEQTAEAHRYVETGRKSGNVVITVGHDSEA